MGLILVVPLVLALAPLHAADLYVATNGTSSGPGTLAKPYSLATAISGKVGQPGDTFWLRGGNYRLGHVATTIHGAAGRPITFRQVIGEKARVDGSFSFFDSIGYVVLRDFELYSSDTNRVSHQTNMGYQPTDINPIGGVDSYSPNFSFINLVVHDHVRHGFYIAPEATNTLIYGCVVYNNGWVGPDNSSGHNFYIQSADGHQEISDNLAFNNAGNNFQIYDNHNGARLTAILLDGNVAFNASILSTTRSYRDYLVGVDAPGVYADGIVFQNNLSYFMPGSSTTSRVQIGREGINGTVTCVGNYLPVGFEFNNWSRAILTNNVIAPRTSDYIVNFQQTLARLSSTIWDMNTYARPAVGKDFRQNSTTESFAAWKSATGFDKQSAYATGNLTGNRVFVRPNRFEPGRAHFIIYNWDNSNSVPVDVSQVLPLGTQYEVRNAQNYFAPPVLAGIFDGKPLPLPMTGLTVAEPNGPLTAPPPTGPRFNVFVLLPLGTVVTSNAPVTLRISNSPADVVISWPTNANRAVLQSTDLSGPTNSWVAVTSAPVVIGNSYNVTNGKSRLRFYRLKL